MIFRPTHPGFWRGNAHCLPPHPHPFSFPLPSTHVQVAATGPQHVFCVYVSGYSNVPDAPYCLLSPPFPPFPLPSLPPLHHMQVATTGPQHVFCIYVSDYSNIPDVRRVLAAMLSLGLVSKSFKPDLFTMAGIYSKNPWGLPVRVSPVRERFFIL